MPLWVIGTVSLALTVKVAPVTLALPPGENTQWKPGVSLGPHGTLLSPPLPIHGDRAVRERRRRRERQRCERAPEHNEKSLHPSSPLRLFAVLPLRRVSAAARGALPSHCGIKPPAKIQAPAGRIPAHGDSGAPQRLAGAVPRSRDAGPRGRRGGLRRGRPAQPRKTSARRRRRACGRAEARRREKSCRQEDRDPDREARERKLAARASARRSAGRADGHPAGARRPAAGRPTGGAPGRRVATGRVATGRVTARRSPPVVSPPVVSPPVVPPVVPSAALHVLLGAAVPVLYGVVQV